LYAEEKRNFRKRCRVRLHIVKRPILYCTVLLSLAMPALGQIRQAEQKGGEQHARRKAEQVMQTQEEYRRLAEEQRRDLANSTPAFTPARMNVDVQMVLAKSELKNFAEAKAATVASIADGDPVWLFVKFNGKLGQWVYKLRDLCRIRPARRLDRKITLHSRIYKGRSECQ
jgi:hypothetical protein